MPARSCACASSASDRNTDLRWVNSREQTWVNSRQRCGISQFEIDQPGLRAFLTTYRDGRWVLMFTDDVERAEGELNDAISRAIGRTDVPVEILTTGRWELAGLVAERFAAGRVFLAGDAAHTLPPTRGGFGANTGIDDVHNLAWKLKAVLDGRSGAALLDTYHEERRAIAWLRHQQTFARPDYARDAGGVAAGERLFDDAALELGQLYRSRAIIGASDDLPAAARPDEWHGQPGTRAPHVWIERGGKRCSTLELFQRGWVVLAGDDAWDSVVDRARTALGQDVEVVSVAREIDASSRASVLTAFGIEATGASLVRPDGYVAWRAPRRPPDGERQFSAALAQVSFAAGQNG